MPAPAAAAAAPPVAETPAPVEETKKERKKRTHDPNAPKRPLTPYFLYMQNARQIIANDLGPGAPKGAVQEEGQRRWAHMEPSDKQVSSDAICLVSPFRILTAIGLEPRLPVELASL